MGWREGDVAVGLLEYWPCNGARPREPSRHRSQGLYRDWRPPGSWHPRRASDLLPNCRSAWPGWPASARTDPAARRIMTTKFFVPRADRRLGERYELIECLGD